MHSCPTYDSTGLIIGVHITPNVLHKSQYYSNAESFFGLISISNVDRGDSPSKTVPAALKCSVRYCNTLGIMGTHYSNNYNH